MRAPSLASFTDSPPPSLSLPHLLPTPPPPPTSSPLPPPPTSFPLPLPPPRLSPSSEARLQLLYKRSVRSSTDPFKRATYCVVGRCEVADNHSDICSKTEDYMWLKVDGTVASVMRASSSSPSPPPFPLPPFPSPPSFP